MPTHEVEILAEGRDGIRSLVLSGAIVTRTGGSTASRPLDAFGAKSSLPEASSGRRRCARWCQHDRPWHPPSHRRRLGAGGEGRGRARGPVRVCAPGHGGADERPARGPAADGFQRAIRAGQFCAGPVPQRHRPGDGAGPRMRCADARRQSRGADRDRGHEPRGLGR